MIRVGIDYLWDILLWKEVLLEIKILGVVIMSCFGNNGNYDSRAKVWVYWL